MRFIVKGKPRGKGRPRTTTIAGHPHIYTDGKTRAYEAEIRSAFVAAGGIMLTGPVVLRVRAEYAIPVSATARKRVEMLSGKAMPIVHPDLDNVLKAVQDALNGVAYKDDSQIVSIDAEKVYAEQPSLKIEVTERETSR